MIDLKQVLVTKKEELNLFIIEGQRGQILLATLRAVMIKINMVDQLEQIISIILNSLIQEKMLIINPIKCQ